MITEISGKTSVYGVIGDPIEHTLSPPMQNRAIAAMGIDAVYVPFNVKPQFLEQAVESFVSLGIKGLNVTVPHKTKIMKFCDSLTDVAKAVGAVNTIINENGRLTGDNTDVHGFEMCLKSGGGFDLFTERVSILGAGGAARSVVYACAMREEVREISIINRTFSKAEKIVKEFKSLKGKKLIPLTVDAENMRNVLPISGLVVNTTSIGMGPDINSSPVPEPDVFHEGQIVCDIIYNPVETKLLKDAGLHGARTVGGIAMLAYQGAKSLSIWTGMEAPVEVMLDTLKERFG